MTQNYNLPAPLGFSDKYGRTLFTSFVAILFIVSLIGYIYLNFFSKSPDITESIVATNEYEVIAIHQATIRPGDEQNTLTIKIVQNSSASTPISVFVKIIELLNFDEIMSA